MPTFSEKELSLDHTDKDTRNERLYQWLLSLGYDVERIVKKLNDGRYSIEGVTVRA